MVFPDHGPTLLELRARREVEEENRRATAFATPHDRFAESDVRRIFAIRASQALEGGRAAILPPIRRRRLVSEARRFGLRVFEANLIIAIVQDGARRGEPPASAATEKVLDLVPVVRKSEATQLLVQRIIISLLLAAGMLALLIRWMNGTATL